MENDGYRLHQLSSHAFNVYPGIWRTGFAIEEIIEPTVEAQDVERFPELDDELRVPNFIVVVLGKPANASQVTGRESPSP